MEKIKIEVGDKMVTLTYEFFDLDTDLEQLLKIDYTNVVGELITFPVVFNRIALLRAEMSNAVNEAKLALDIYVSRMNKYYRKNLKGKTSRGPSKEEVEDAVHMDEGYEQTRLKYINRQRDYEYMDAIYWSAKSKDKKLDTFSQKITPKEFEQDIVEGQVNNIYVNFKTKLIPDVNTRR